MGGWGGIYIYIYIYNKLRGRPPIWRNVRKHVNEIACYPWFDCEIVSSCKYTTSVKHHMFLKMSSLFLAGVPLATHEISHGQAEAKARNPARPAKEAKA